MHGLWSETVEKANQDVLGFQAVITKHVTILLCPVRASDEIGDTATVPYTRTFPRLSFLYLFLRETTWFVYDAY